MHVLPAGNGINQRSFCFVGILLLRTHVVPALLELKVVLSVRRACENRLNTLVQHV
jgi:hypothetical protein